MAEVLPEHEVVEHSDDVAIKQGLSRTINRRHAESTRKQTTPRIGGQVEVCGTVYKNFMDEDAEQVSESTVDLATIAKRSTQEKRKLVIIMVGLPGRGKTYLCNKLMCYLNWCALACARATLATATATPLAPMLMPTCRCSALPRSACRLGAAACLLPQEERHVSGGAHMQHIAEVQAQCLSMGSREGPFQLLPCTYQDAAPVCTSNVLTLSCRLGHISKHFNVGSYRRKLKDDIGADVQDAAFFDHQNEVQRRALPALCNACLAWTGSKAVSGFH